MAEKTQPIPAPDAPLSRAAFAEKYGKSGNNESYMAAQLDRVTSDDYSAFLDEFASNPRRRAQMQNDLPETAKGG